MLTSPDKTNAFTEVVSPVEANKKPLELLGTTLTEWSEWLKDESAERTAQALTDKLEEMKQFEKTFAKKQDVAIFVAGIGDVKKALAELSRILKAQDKKAALDASTSVTGSDDHSGVGRLAGSAKVAFIDFKAPTSGTGWEIDTELLQAPSIPVIIPAERLAKTVQDIVALPLI